MDDFGPIPDVWLDKTQSEHDAMLRMGFRWIRQPATGKWYVEEADLSDVRQNPVYAYSQSSQQEETSCGYEADYEVSVDTDDDGESESLSTQTPWRDFTPSFSPLSMFSMPSQYL